MGLDSVDIRNRMTLYEYLKLDVNAKGDYLWAHGEIVARSVDAVSLSAFYSLHDFYVEVVMDQEFNKIVSLAPFKQGERYERMIAAMETPTV